MEIHLNRGTTFISPEDLDIMDQRSWWLSSQGYVRSDQRLPKRRTLHFHRVVMERMLDRPLLATEEVDHINRDPADNRRENLRLATRREQMLNRGYANRSGYRGVYLPQQKFQAAIKIGDSKHQIGSFNTAEEAAWMYDQYALALHGDFATLNFDYL